jgi:hypothetical protein
MFIYIYIEYFKNPAFYIWIIELFYILHIEYLKLPNRYGTVLHSSLLLWRTSCSGSENQSQFLLTWTGTTS